MTLEYCIPTYMLLRAVLKGLTRPCKTLYVIKNRYFKIFRLRKLRIFYSFFYLMFVNVHNFVYLSRFGFRRFYRYLQFWSLFYPFSMFLDLILPLVFYHQWRIYASINWGLYNMLWTPYGWVSKNILYILSHVFLRGWLFRW